MIGYFCPFDACFFCNQNGRNSRVHYEHHHAIKYADNKEAPSIFKAVYPTEILDFFTKLWERLSQPIQECKPSGELQEIKGKPQPESCYIKFSNRIPQNDEAISSFINSKSVADSTVAEIHDYILSLSFDELAVEDTSEDMSIN